MEIDYKFKGKIKDVTFDYCTFVGKVKGVKRLSFICGCGKSFTKSVTLRLDIKGLSCGCVDEAYKIKRENEAVEFFHNKQTKSSETPHWCSYCSSFRSNVFENRAGKYCENCYYLSNNKILIFKSFDQIMSEWNPVTHNLKWKKIPYLKGNNIRGYEVRGFTYVSSDWYESVSKFIWIKVKNYVKMSMSKANLKIADVITQSHVKAIFQHNYTSGLVSGSKYVTDHLNGKTLDNRNENLRVCTVMENSYNSSPTIGSTSIFKGVSFIKSKNKFRATLNIAKSYYSKPFTSEEDAALYYDTLLRLHRKGEFNRYNFPEIGERGLDGKLRTV